MNTLDTRTILLIASPLIIISLILVIVAVVSIARKSVPWNEKWFWLPVLLISTAGPIIYFVIGSPMLDEKAARRQDKESDQ